PRDRWRPAASQRVARRVGGGPAGGHQGRVGRPARRTRHPGSAVPDAERPDPHLSPRHVPSPSGDGVIPSPNIWQHTATYEVENRAFDREGLVEAAIREVADWA